MYLLVLIQNTFCQNIFQVDIWGIRYKVGNFRPQHLAPQIFAAKSGNFYPSKTPSPNTKAQLLQPVL